MARIETGMSAWLRISKNRNQCMNGTYLSMIYDICICINNIAASLEKACRARVMAERSWTTGLTGLLRAGVQNPCGAYKKDFGRDIKKFVRTGQTFFLSTLMERDMFLVFPLSASPYGKGRCHGVTEGIRVNLQKSRHLLSFFADTKCGAVSGVIHRTDTMSPLRSP